MPNSADNKTMEKFYRDLFNIQGYQDFIVFAVIYVIDSNCSHSVVYHRMCTNCRKNHAMSDAAIQARAAQDQIVSNKEYVRKQLKNERAMWGMQVINA